MAGIVNDVLYALNADFTGGNSLLASESNGLVTNGKMWIGSTALNAGGTHINVGSITSPSATLTMGYSSPNIVMEVTGAAAGKVLQGNGVGSPPTYSTATYPSATVGSGKILYDNGTNFVTSVPTFPVTASATSRKMIVSDGANWVASTETWAVPGTSGNVLTSDGANWTSASAALPSQLNVATITLTSAQIKALHGTPIELIAAPGAGKTIIIMSPVWAKFTYGGNNVFSAGSGQVVSLYYGTTTNLTSSLVTNVAINGTNTVHFNQSVISTTGSASTNFENKAINAYNVTVAEISGNAANDNTISITVLYYIATL